VPRSNRRRAALAALIDACLAPEHELHSISRTPSARIGASNGLTPPFLHGIGWFGCAPRFAQHAVAKLVDVPLAPSRKFDNADCDCFPRPIVAIYAEGRTDLVERDGHGVGCFGLEHRLFTQEWNDGRHRTHP
jgi:hypothetical protein